MRPFIWGGKLFVSRHDLLRAGFRGSLNAGDIIELEFDFVDSSITRLLYEIHGFRPSTSDYWVRRVITDPHEAGLTSDAG